MLTEFHQVKQEESSGARRRWFEGDGMELIVWYGRDRVPEGFQLCYQADDRQERALTWRPGLGFSHATVDAGDSRPDKNMTPILVSDGPVPWTRIEASFAAQCAGLEPTICDYVLGVLKTRTA